MSSSFFAKATPGHFSSEHRYYIVFGLFLCGCAILLLALPVYPSMGILSFVASWMLFIGVIMSVIRPLVFRRGVADFTMGLIAALFYGLVGWSVGGTSINSIEGYRYIICLILLFLGITRLLVFARMLSAAGLPLLLVSCFIDITAALFLLMGYPNDQPIIIYWYSGMLLLIDGIEQMVEANKLRVLVGSSVKESTRV